MRPKRRRIAQAPTTPTRVYRQLRPSPFPITFFIRNLAYLGRERWFAEMSAALRRRWAVILFRERFQCFRDVRRLIHTLDGTSRPPGDRSTIQAAPSCAPPSDYCDHCGGCCETASGLAEFPAESRLPSSWRAVFGDGLGPGHRFCPFMWERDRAGKSLCAIHPWRARACRVFEADDCASLKQDQDFVSFGSEAQLKTLQRLLPRILRRGLRPRA